MIYVGIDVAKDKHDCFAMNSDGEILIENFSFQNNSDGFNLFFHSISQFNESSENIKVGLEATGHYSNNILNFLTSKGFNVFVINPLQTNLFLFHLLLLYNIPFHLLFLVFRLSLLYYL